MDMCNTVCIREQNLPLFSTIINIDQTANHRSPQDLDHYGN